MATVALKPLRRDTHQAQKSAATRVQIIEAAVTCLLRHGYADTTTPRIAEIAQLSRGAMMHHFTNRMAVIQAVINHLHTKRLRAFRRAVSQLPQQAPRLHDALMAYWRHVTHPLFIAFHELTVASRSDPELETILRPAQLEFDRQWHDLAVELFPEWQRDRESFELALALSRTQLEGMAVVRLSGQLEAPMEARLLDHLERQLAALKPALL
jgi:AcrR family transcriptional regulator